MKKQQKEHIRVGGNIARARYQQFMSAPRWASSMTTMSEEEKRTVLRFLSEITGQEAEVLKWINDERKHHPERPHVDATELCDRIMGLMRAAWMVENIQPGELSLYSDN